MPSLLPIVLALTACCLAVVLAAWSRGLVYVGRTRSGLTLVHDDYRVMGERIRVLEVGGTYQSATYLDDRWCDPVFPYHRLFDHVLDAWPERDGPSSVAVLGGGGYALPKHLVAHVHQAQLIEVVEIDPAIERIARRHFLLDKLERTYGAQASGRLQLHVGDAYEWLLGQERRYDAILNDCFSALEPESSLMTSAGAALIASRLEPGGVYLTNVVSALEGEEASVLYATIDALASAFAHIWVYPCGADEPASRENNVVVATDRACTFPGAWKWPTSQEDA